ncbi:MAG: TonB-dependent receptor [Kofleriaceae bacterium]|nr:TonB-dependent receptor [Kofleriaceae bacterium]
MGLLAMPAFAEPPAAPNDVAQPPTDVDSLVDAAAIDAPVADAAADAELEAMAAAQARDETIEIHDRYRTKGEQLEESAEAVQVVDTSAARQRTADLGEVLARTNGIGVQRSGGLGSGTRFSLAGFTDDQVRFFVDGLPLELVGFPFGLANVPVNLVARAEVFRGVVPVRFGADALGGAVNLVTEDDKRPTYRAISYQTGSFGTHRMTMVANQKDEARGAFVKLTGFYDHTANDYPIDVRVPSRDPETRGQEVPAELRRFHDGYTAAGASLELGTSRRKWADRLSVRGFAAGYERDLQSNPTMQTPYGEVVSDLRTVGGVGRYQHALGAGIDVDLALGGSRERSNFLDVGLCDYDWYGACERMRARAGELDEGNPRDDTLWQNALFGRFVVGKQLAAAHVLRASVAPTYVARHGVERLRNDAGNFGALSAERDLLTVVSGLEYAAAWWDGRLENIAFAKAYLQAARSSARIPGTGTERDLARDTARFGGGNALRLRITDSVLAKASYEYATRLPSAGEIFGDVLLTNENLLLRPEVSHNANLGVALDLRQMRAGSVRGEVNAFVRDADDLIVLLNAYGQRFRNENVYGARSLGVEASAGWTSPGSLLVLDANATYQDFRNTEGRGDFAQFVGDRIPNRPYLFANVAATLQRRGTLAADDELALSWHSRYVGAFFLFWESAGLMETKRSIPRQLVHSLALTYGIGLGDGRRVTLSGELADVTDERAFDFYGAQRPGRALFFKTTAEL